ncbi:hypothetical protein EUGRSUZ_F00609 [Eucalyptus grandis]|uniref:Uncharacterized protein n=2 Tax=Eucalyptus grandis TaxID=71139 RepID=A0ACC3KDP3_EUCGR|nr:hypothetical protein EUGRSUZ_F00609 [Eucalyptus grandis]
MKQETRTNRTISARSGEPETGHGHKKEHEKNGRPRVPTQLTGSDGGRARWIGLRLSALRPGILGSRSRIGKNQDRPSGDLPWLQSGQGAAADRRFWLGSDGQRRPSQLRSLSFAAGSLSDLTYSFSSTSLASSSNERALKASAQTSLPSGFLTGFRAAPIGGINGACKTSPATLLCLRGRRRA